MRTSVSRFATLVVALVVLAFSFPALGQKPMGGSVAGMLPLGSVTQAETYLATNTSYLAAFFWSRTGVDQYVEIPIADERYLTRSEHAQDKKEVVRLFNIMLSNCLKMIAESDKIDRTLPIRFVIFTVVDDGFGNGANGFSAWGDFMVGDSPVITPEQMQMPDPFPILLPGIRWARIEVWPTGQTNDVSVLDYLLDPATDPVDAYMDILYVPLTVLQQGFQGKISIFVDRFELFDEKGNPIEETPFRTAIAKSGDTLVVTVLGGDSGRAFRLVSRASLATGQPVPLTATLFVPPVYRPTVAAYVPISGTMRFYQVETIEVPPK